MDALLRLLAREISDTPGFQAFAFSIVHGAATFLAAMAGLLLHDQLGGMPWGTPGSLNLTLVTSIVVSTWIASAWLCFRTARSVYGFPLTAVFLLSSLGAWLLAAVLFMGSYSLVLRDFLEISISTLRAQVADQTAQLERLVGMLRTLLFVVLGHHALAVALLSFPFAWRRLAKGGG